MSELVTNLIWVQELVTNLIWIVAIILVGFPIVYSLVRLAAIAWHKTKREYDTPPPERKRQNDEELYHGKEDN